MPDQTDTTERSEVDADPEFAEKYKYVAPPSGYSVPRASKGGSIAATALAWIVAWLIWSFLQTDAFKYARLTNPIASVVALLVVVGTLGLVVEGLRLRRRRVVRAERASFASKVVDLLDRGEATELFVLYLRPFEFGRGHEYDDMVEGTQTFEAALADCVAPDAQLVAVGGGNRDLGAGRAALPDAEWRKAVSKLLEACESVVVVAGASAGLEWELGEIAGRDLLWKSVFVVPLGVCESDYIDMAVLASRHDWNLPPYSRRLGGFAFTLDANGSVLKRHRLPVGMKPGRYRKIFRELFPSRAFRHEEPNGVPAANQTETAD